MQLDPDEDGPKVHSVLPEGGAKKAGVKEGDLVLAVGGRKVINIDTLRNALRRYKPGDVVVVKVKRGDDTLSLKAKLGKAPPSRGEIQNRMGKKLSERRDGFPVILQHDQVLEPTECGGPVVDLDGKAVGVNIASAARPESYAIPSEAVRRLLPELKSGRLAELTVEGARELIKQALPLLAGSPEKIDVLPVGGKGLATA